MCPYLNVSEECHQCTDCPQASSIKGHFVILVRTMTRSAFLVRICEVSENQRSEENQIVHKDVDVLEGQPPPDGLLSVLSSTLALLVQPVYGPGDEEEQVNDDSSWEKK